MENRAHGNTGRRNAAKTDTKDSVLHVRIHSKTKALCVKKAQKEGMKLSAWIQKTLDIVCR